MTEGGLIYFDNAPVSDDQVLAASVRSCIRANPEMKVSISAEQQALHGDVISLLDSVRSSGIDKDRLPDQDCAAANGAPSRDRPAALSTSARVYATQQSPQRAIARARWLI